ncbi:MAG: phytanoyl-CoA dioxygenase family protein [Gemmatimonadetes bacterium]|nr:phytanoyl-CoA dioxygenase family protein [Gemmatimonadota bacterium]MYD26009.1 phytanoyl-CoA dioxygenase family protein [Gemmatimonadota bacterium]
MTAETLLSQDRKAAFSRDGYFIAEAFLTPDEVESIRREITAIVDRYPDVPEELVQIEPAVRRGAVTPESRELGVRKLFRMTRHSELFHALALHPRMVGIAVELIGPDVALFQSMLLMKPPRFGGQKVWHQDNAYFRLEPNDVFGFWIALDDADVANGCMHVIPGSHRAGIGEHGGVADDYGLSSAPTADDAVACVMKSGDALVFHGETYHYTPPNTSDRRRRALQYHYASTHCRSTKDSPFKSTEPEVIVAGAGAVARPPEG